MVFPIMFAAVIGRFLTSIAAWKLERGVTVATVEHLMGSRTVFGAIITPFRLRVLQFTFVPLICLWTLSPLGSQAKQGPEILDSFASMLRDSPYIQVDTGPSTEDGPDKARRLNHTVVVLADTRPMDAAGFIALTTNDDVEKPVQLLRRDRKYL